MNSSKENKIMKTKVGTVLEKEVVRQLRQRAAKEGRSMNEIISDALTNYFRVSDKPAEQRREAVKRLCSKPFQLSPRELNEILEEDYFEQ